MYKMMAIDIDDTLITADKRVTPRTRAALIAAAEKGVVITLATGRMHASACRIARQLELNVPIITYQGSMVKNLIDQESIYERFVPYQASEYIFDYCEKNGYHLQGYYQDQLYARQDNEKIKAYAQLSDVSYHIKPDFHRLIQLPMTKLLIYEEPEVLDRIASELAPMLGDEVHVTKSKPVYLEFTHPQGTKGQALSFLANRYNCSMQEVIAFGDSWNDTDMLEMAGLGVAMENAVPSLKEAADYITLSNENDGIAHVIEQFVL